MSRRLLLPLVFCALFLVAWIQSAALTPSLKGQAARIKIQSLVPPRFAGTFPDQWINGADCGTEPPMQVHAYNEDTYIIRQSKCESFEAPFLYLLFGRDKALLLDTGAAPGTPVRNIVFEVVQEWLARNGRESIPLIVAHTHGHFDHVAADSQFAGDPLVDELVGIGLLDVKAFWGFEVYPGGQPTFDLGGRVLDVLGTPGHHPSSITVYDRNTHLLLTGDIVYPGHLFVFSQFDWQIFVKSIERLVNFAATHPVEWVVGCHVEMSATPGLSFKYTTPFHPNEHRLEFRPSILTDVFKASRSMQGNPECKTFDEFVIHPVYKCGITWND